MKSCKDNKYTLAEDFIHSVSDDIPAVEEFLQFCRDHAASNVSNPQFFRQLSNHSFFTHRFLLIYNFLYDLPAKNETEKANFFEFVILFIFTYFKRISVFH